MHRFFVPAEALAGRPVVALRGEVAHQIARVLRLRTGERIVVFDGGGREWVVRLAEVTPTEAAGEIETERANTAEPRLRLTLFQAVLKGDQMDFVLQKGTEVGVAAFAPVVTERTIAQGADDRKLARWQRIVQEAAEQSGRAVLPPVTPPLSLDDACRRLALGSALTLWEEERATGLGEALGRLPRPLPPLALLVGPEGGLTAREVDQAVAAGAVSVSLGPRILRAETAGLIAASALFYAAGDLGGAPP
jgi:16S rRNA (uracil1498-N3)-methyltransferase